MFSETVEYAPRAMVQLAADPSGSATTKEIAAKAKVPSAYLAKVLQSMRRSRLIHFRRGVGGGVTLAKPAGKDHAAGHHRRRRAAEADTRSEGGLRRTAPKVDGRGR